MFLYIIMQGIHKLVYAAMQYTWTEVNMTSHSVKNKWRESLKAPLLLCSVSMWCLSFYHNNSSRCFGSVQCQHNTQCVSLSGLAWEQTVLSQLYTLSTCYRHKWYWRIIQVKLRRIRQWLTIMKCEPIKWLIWKRWWRFYLHQNYPSHEINNWIVKHWNDKANSKGEIKRWQVS